MRKVARELKISILSCDRGIMWRAKIPLTADGTIEVFAILI
jgi:hypothetical protein